MQSDNGSKIKINEDLWFTSESSLNEVNKKIDENGMGVCFYVSRTGKLLGVLTDGDIRRALIEKNSVDFFAYEAASENFSYGFIDQTVNDWALKIDNRIKVLPLVDRDFNLINFYSIQNITHIPISSPLLKNEEISNLANAISSGWISSTGFYVSQFEKDFSAFCQTDFATTTSNGTTALQLALLALNVGPGDEVIVPDLTFAATINAVLHCGATPVIADVCEKTWCLSADKLENSITAKTKCVIVVHLCGQVADMDEIMALSARHGFRVVEDCAEAHGAKYKGKLVGSIGDVGCFSFFANKIISTGEGGMCTTNIFEVFEKMSVIKNHGMSKDKKYWHDQIGYNFRITNLQAAIGVAQLSKIKEYLYVRYSFEQHYKRLLPSLGFDCDYQNDLEDRDRVIWLVTVLSKSVDEKIKLMEYFTSKKIDIRPFFYPLSSMPIYSEYAKYKCQVSKKVSKLGVFLPTFNEKSVIDKLK